MVKKLMAVAVLALTAVPVLASEATYDQRNGTTLAQSKGSESRPAPCACGCPHR